MLVWWTKRSLLPSSGVMKPKPFSSLNHLTVPVAMHSSTAVSCCVCRGSYLATVCERLHCFAGSCSGRTWRTVPRLAGAGPCRKIPFRVFSGAHGRRCRQTETVAPPRRRLMLAAAAGLALADASIVTLALPRLLSELHATVEGV